MGRGTFVSILILLSALVICSWGCAEDEVERTQTPTMAVTVSPGNTPGPTVTKTPTPTVLLLEISQPRDGDEVSTDVIIVSGKTVPGAVVSALVDDTVEIASVAQDGSFNITVNLEEGPNLIDVVASDQQGNEKSFSIAIIYIP